MNSKIKIAVSAVLGIAGAALSQTSAAQTAPQFNSNAGALEGGSVVALQEVVVTAQKREEKLHDVPMGVTAITADELEKAVGAVIRRADRLLLRTDINKTYMMNDWAKRAPYLRSDGTRWCIERGLDCRPTLGIEAEAPAIRQCLLRAELIGNLRRACAR